MVVPSLRTTCICNTGKLAQIVLTCKHILCQSCFDDKRMKSCPSCRQPKEVLRGLKHVNLKGIPSIISTFYVSDLLVF